MDEINDMVKKLNNLARQVVKSGGDDSLWYVYDNLSQELYHTANWYNNNNKAKCVINERGINEVVPLMCAKDYGHIFNIVTYSVFFIEAYI